MVTVEQYLSLHQDSSTNTPNDLVSLARDSLAVTVTVTDGDGDKASAPTDVVGPDQLCRRRPDGAGGDGERGDGGC